MSSNLSVHQREYTAGNYAALTFSAVALIGSICLVRSDWMAQLSSAKRTLLKTTLILLPVVGGVAALCPWGARAIDRALAEAARVGDLEEAKRLLDQGADPNSRDKNGNTPLIEAGANGQREVIELLLARGADIDAANVDGTTPFCAACLFHRDETALFLLEKGADPKKVGAIFSPWDLPKTFERLEKGVREGMKWRWWQTLAAHLFDIDGRMETRFSEGDTSYDIDLKRGHVQTWVTFLRTALRDEAVAEPFRIALAVLNKLEALKGGHAIFIEASVEGTGGAGAGSHAVSSLLLPDGHLFVCNLENRRILRYRFDPQELEERHLKALAKDPANIGQLEPFAAMDPISEGFPRQRAYADNCTWVCLMQALWVMVGPEEFKRLEAKMKREVAAELKEIAARSAYPNDDLLEAVASRSDR